MADNAEEKTTDKEYTLYEDEDGAQFVLMPDQKAPQEGENSDNGETAQNDEYKQENEEAQDYDSVNAPSDGLVSAPSDGLVSDPNAEHTDPNDEPHGVDDDAVSHDPGEFDEEEYNRLNPMGISAAGSQLASVSPVKPLSPPPEPTPPPRERTLSELSPPPQESTSPPLEPRRRQQKIDASAERHTEQSPPRRPAKGYIKGGMLIVDGGRWEPKSKVDHVNRQYQRTGGDVEIFNDKLKWHGQPRVDTKQKDYKPTGGDKSIFDEKLQWKASPRVDTDNKQHSPGGGGVVILHERLKWTKRPMVDAHNVDYAPAKGNFQMFEERPQWQAHPRVDAKNQGYTPAVGNATIIDDKPTWQKKARVDHQKPYYKPGGGNIQVVSHNVKWEAGPRVDAINNSYVPPPEGGNVRIMHEKLEWNTEPKVEALNPYYKKGGGNVKIPSSKMSFKKNSVARIETLDKYYEYEPSPDNVEFDPKTKRWVARGRVMRRPGTGKSLDSQLAFMDPKDGNTAPINKAPAGTTYTEYATARKSRNPNGYGSRFQEKKMNGPPLNLPPIERASPYEKNVVFKSKDLVSPRTNDNIGVKTHKSQAKAKFKHSQKRNEPMAEPAPLVHRPVTPEYMYRQKPKPLEKQALAKSKQPLHKQAARQVPKKQRIERLDMKTLEKKNKDGNTLHPDVNPDIDYDEYSNIPVYTPTDSSFNDPEPEPALRKGYNAHRRDREHLKHNNKFSTAEGMYHVPTRKRAEKVYS